MIRESIERFKSKPLISRSRGSPQRTTPIIGFMDPVITYDGLRLQLMHDRSVILFARIVATLHDVQIARRLF